MNLALIGNLQQVRVQNEVDTVSKHPGETAEPRGKQVLC